MTASEMKRSAPVNFIPAAAGKVRAVCEFCDCRSAPQLARQRMVIAMNTAPFIHYCHTCQRSLTPHEVERVEYLLVCSDCGGEVDCLPPPAARRSECSVLRATIEYTLLAVIGAMLAFSLVATP